MLRSYFIEVSMNIIELLDRLNEELANLDKLVAAWDVHLASQVKIDNTK